MNKLSLLSVLFFVTIAVTTGCQSKATAPVSVVKAKVIENVENTAIVSNLGQRHNLSSKILNEQRELLIHVPELAASSDIKLPVLYVLDGARHFHHAVATVTTLYEGGKAPQILVVGVPNNTGQRMRDAYDKPEQYIQFLNLEVLPYITANYPTSGQHILFGHSAMGAVAVSTFASSQTEFNQFVASSSATDPEQTQWFQQVALQLQALEEAKTGKKSLYFSATDAEREGKGFTQGAEKLARVFMDSADEQTRWQYDFIPGQNHTTVAYLSLFKGVSWLFDDFEAPAITNYQAFIDYGGMAELSRFFVKRGNEYAVSQAVPISTITALAFAFMGEGKTKEGISLLLENVANYRDPSRIYGALGFLYEQESAKEKALLAYQQALKFAVSNKQNSESQRYYENKVAQLGVE